MPQHERGRSHRPALEPPTLRVDGNAVLRPWRAADAVPLYEAVDGSREHLAEWLDWVDGYELGRAEHFISGANERASRGEMLELALEVGGAIAGSCGFVDVVPAHREAEIGYWLGLPFVGRGLMTRTVAALAEYAFESLEMHRVAIAVYGGNTSSRAIPERLGFRQEGVFTAARWYRDRWHDRVWYGMLAEDWRSLRLHRSG
ncbi:MAG: GNAT family protein [Chloroflexi bacterium]|nr:GNAT family protein [Chloroflexota bacterium]